MELTHKIVIAVDGFSSCGKSTFAKKIANLLNYVFIDTGAMYRAVSLYAIKNGFVRDNKVEANKLLNNLNEIHIRFKRTNNKVCTFLNNSNVEDEIRGVEVSDIVSEVSKIKEVRRHLVNLQQNMGKEKGLVMDGRDIGTVVFPDAEIKIFMTASSKVRAQRRFDELKQKNIKVSFEEIQQNIEKRDFSDLNRSESPLQKASDAYELDNSFLTLDEQMLWFETILKNKGLLRE